MRTVAERDETKSDPAAPVGGPKKLFIVGCPRSGTTWVQLLLSQLPTVATAPETQIFAYYLTHFERQWRHELAGADREQGAAGLSRLLSEEEFIELCRLNASFVLDRIGARNPGAALVVEKSPKHALQAELIRRVFPDALFLHVIRDPRDTAASLLAAGRSWGRGWAPQNAITAARWWVDHVTSARRLAGSTDGYREVKYESLRENAASELQSILDWLGIPERRESCERIAAACDIDRLRGGAAAADLPIPGEKNPAGFFRKGKPGGWRDDLTGREVRQIEHICGPTMETAQYARTSRAWSPALLGIPLHDGLGRIRESIDWQLARIMVRL